MDLNQEVGEKLQARLNEVYGAEKTTFYRADVTSEAQFRGKGGVPILSATRR